MDYKHKYLKYKTKYLEYKTMIQDGGRKPFCKTKPLKRYLDKTNIKTWSYILPKDLHKKLQDKKWTDKHMLLDIRKKEDYAKGHIEGAHNIFWLDLLEEENQELLKKLSKGKTIVIICYLGHTSSQALVILKLLGYDAISMKFGMGVPPVENMEVKGWLEYDFPVVSTL